MDLADDLARAVPRIRVSRDPADRVAYARDLWPRHHLAVRAGDVAPSPPGCIVWPETTADVSAIVRWAAATRTPVVPFGAGSGVCAGVLPAHDGVVIDLKKMTRWRALDPAVPSIDVEAGQMGLPFEEELNRRGFTLGHFPSSILCSTVGGWVAARSAGQCSGYYGKIEDMVLALECVTGTGDVVTLRRRAHGPDLVPFVVGSEGTLAVVTAATLRLHPAPMSRGFAAWSFDRTEEGWEAMRAMFQAGLRPAVCRLYDPFDAMLARRGGASSSRAGGHAKPHAPGRGGAALRALLGRPHLVNELLASRIAERAMGGALLVCVFEGSDAEVDGREGGDRPARDAETARRLLESRGARYEGEGPARRWLQHRYSISYRQAPTLAAGLFLDTMEVAATWSRLGALYEGVRRALGEEVFVMAHFSHPYPDGCCIYFSFAGAAPPGTPGARWDAASEAIYDATWKRAIDAAIAAGGTLAHHHGVGRSKAPRLGPELGDAGVAAIRALQRAFDPHGILNPGALRPAPSAATVSAESTAVGAS